MYICYPKIQKILNRQYLIYISVYPLIWLFSRMPFWLLYRLSDLLYIIMYKLAGYRKGVVRENLALVFADKSPEERLKIEKKFYRHFSDLFVEMIKAFKMPLKQMQKHFVFKNVELLNELSAKGKDIVVVGGHYANWEWVFSLAALTRAFPIATYLKINNKYFEKLMLTSRQRFGGKLIETKHLRNSLRSFKENNELFILGLLSDQSPQKHRARYWRSFLGVEKVPVHTGHEEIAKQYDTGFVFMYIRKIKRGYYEVEFELITETPNEYPDYRLTDIYLEKLEKQIRRQPEYYLWTHRRFKHRQKETDNR